MVLWWNISFPLKVMGYKFPLPYSRPDPHLSDTSTSHAASWSGWLVRLLHGSHMPLGFPHLHIPPSATPTDKPQDQSSRSASARHAHSRTEAEVSSTAQWLGKPTGRMRRLQPGGFVMMAPGLFPSVADSSRGALVFAIRCSICCLG